MLKTFALVASLWLAAPALAQTAPPASEPAPPPEFIAAAQSFGQCVGRTASATTATTTPEIGAQQALAGCAAEKTAMETRFESWVSGPAFPEVGRAPARAQFAAQMAQVERRVANGIREARAKAPPAPQAPPVPGPTPTPSPGR